MRYLFVLAILTAAGTACNRSAPDREATAADAGVPAGFLDFYQRFLTDSLYQMEHILFPLQGLPDRADSATIASGDFRWQSHDWVMHRPIDPASGFSVNLRPVTDTYVQEDIRHQSGRYGMERRYAFMDDGWYLIYYAGLNSLEGDR